MYWVDNNGATMNDDDNDDDNVSKKSRQGVFSTFNSQHKQDPDSYSIQFKGFCLNFKNLFSLYKLYIFDLKGNV